MKEEDIEKYNYHYEIAGKLSNIKEKLILAKKKDKKKLVFGAKSHKYKFKNSLTNDDVNAFEKKYNITLPDGYKAFITQIGNEGKSYSNYIVDKSVAGPFYGIYPLEKNNGNLLYNPLEYLQKIFTLEEMSDEKWDTLVENLPEEDDAYDSAINELFAGILPIGSQGGTGVTGLILNGVHKGEII